MSSLNKLRQGDETTPLPVNQVLDHETDVVTWLCEISRKLDILIEYQAILHKVNLNGEL